MCREFRFEFPALYGKGIEMYPVDREPEEALLYLFNEGKYYNAADLFGAHMGESYGKTGARFTVWAPGAKSVHVYGDFNSWNDWDRELSSVGSTGVWSLFVPGAKPGDKYKYVIETASGEKLIKSDPFAFWSEKRPSTASVVWDLGFEWSDGRWISKREKTDHFRQPKNIYEVHAGSWKKEGEDFYNYRRLADELIPYVKDMGYTHIELLPLMEHPFDGSWGYQVTGFYSATSRYGTPQDLKYLVNKAHKAGIGVIFDWVPGHFCKDAHGLYKFNGSFLYEKEEHPQWGTMKFDYGRKEVRSFLLSNAMFWIKEYHADGLRIDGVSSMLYLNFGIDDEKKKKFNIYGDERDLEAVSLLQELSAMVGQNCPGVFTVAEESSAWPLVTYPPEDGGLGFHYKWDMGWMNDTLRYISTDTLYRKYDHNLITFSMMYTFNENFILALSHDEVVHGKASLIGKMPGDYYQKFSGLRLLSLYQMTHPGAKLNFMGYEFGQFVEWREYEGLEWFLPEQYDAHRKQLAYTRALNNFYLKEKALYSNDRNWKGFQWIDADNAEQSVFIFCRTCGSGQHKDVVVLNFGTGYYEDFRVGVPKDGIYTESFSTDDLAYGGSGCLNTEPRRSENIPCHGQQQSVSIRLAPLSGVVLSYSKV
ncbi:MAG: 1,4-alpha-glucan branching protein GlgB [Firmicutes bacterium]|nr:1,4-alpha-glucan branching protein GlgB [Bacillota bacterium]